MVGEHDPRLIGQQLQRNAVEAIVFEALYQGVTDDTWSEIEKNSVSEEKSQKTYKCGFNIQHPPQEDKDNKGTSLLRGQEGKE